MRRARTWLIVSLFAGVAALVLLAIGAPLAAARSMMAVTIMQAAIGLGVGLFACYPRRPAQDAISAPRVLVGTIESPRALPAVVWPRQALEAPAGSQETR
jgi:hypothetical protein